MKVKMLTDIYGQAHWYDLEVQNVRVFKDRVKFYFTLSDGKRYTNEYNITDVIQLKVNGKMRVKNGMKLLGGQENDSLYIFDFSFNYNVKFIYLDEIHKDRNSEWYDDIYHVACDILCLLNFISQIIIRIGKGR